nr:hypothetical protein [Tanacetum cinerariifolium]
MDHEVGTYGMAIDYCIMKEGMSILRGRKSVPGMNSSERENGKRVLLRLHVSCMIKSLYELLVHDLIEGKGKAIVTKEQAAHSLLALNTSKRRSTIDQFIFQRRTPAIEVSLSGPSNKLMMTHPPILSVTHHLLLMLKQVLYLRRLTVEVVMDEDQTGLDPGESHGALSGLDPEPTHDEFMADLYLKVQESLKFLADEHVILEDPISSTETLSSMKNLEDAYAIGYQFINDKSTEDEPEKPNVEAEVVSMVTVLIYQASSSVPPLVFTLELKDLPHKIDEAVYESVKEAVHVALQAPLRDRFRELPKADMKEILNQGMFETCTYKSLPEHVVLYEALEASMKQENMDKYLTEKDKSMRYAPMTSVPLTVYLIGGFIVKNSTLTDTLLTQAARADYQQYIIAEKDFKNLYPSDFEDLNLLLLQGHLIHLSGSDKRILSTAVNLWTRNLVIRQRRVEDFQRGIESYQKQLNLTNLGWDAKGFEYKHDYTIIESPHAVVFPVGNNERKMMRFNEIYKFSDGTLTNIMEALDYRVKEYKTKMELELEQTQQGSSHKVSVSTEGVEELKRKNIRVTPKYHNEDGNPARANIKQAHGSYKEGDGVNLFRQREVHYRMLIRDQRI